MTFEYLRAIARDGTVTWDSTDEDDPESEDSIDSYLKMRGAQGWELVCVTKLEGAKDGLSGALGGTAIYHELYLKRSGTS
jgi:hypothetical protein